MKTGRYDMSTAKDTCHVNTQSLIVTVFSALEKLDLEDNLVEDALESIVARIYSQKMAIKRYKKQLREIQSLIYKLHVQHKEIVSKG
jgi:hypothetical protein